MSLRSASSSDAGEVPGDEAEVEERGEVGIVLIATPDHWHPLAMIAAMETGADIYVEKPIRVGRPENWKKPEPML
jgi:predicted dehydrogenase